MHSLWWEAIRKLKELELFAGTCCLSDGFKNNGHDVFTVDIDEKFDVDWYADVSKITTSDIIERFGVPDVLWAGTPCESYSVAAISRHRKKNSENGSLDPISEHAIFCDEMNKHLLKIIDELLEINPNMIWFIENPVGALRKMDFMQGLPRYTITYCTYMRKEPWETRRMKKTDIWTNHPNPKFKEPCKNGCEHHPPCPRGSNKYGSQALKSSVERSMYPIELIEHIVDICEEYFESK